MLGKGMGRAVQEAALKIKEGSSPRRSVLMGELNTALCWCNREHCA